MKNLEELTSAERKFAEAYAKNFLPCWAKTQLLSEDDSFKESPSLAKLGDMKPLVLAIARQKGWISRKADKFQLLTKGFNTAASALTPSKGF